MDGLTTTAIPLPVRIELCRAAVQVMADRHGLRMLHIKGAAVHRSIRPIARSGGDVDVICDPQRIDMMHDSLLSHGWTLYSTFEDGSPFGHAQTYWHRDWGYLDLHRRFPGIGVDDGVAFELLWAERGEHICAGRPVAVPSPDAQMVLLMLNAARGSEDHGGELMRLWEVQSTQERARRLALVTRLRAEVAFAAATGRLEEYRGHREYALWKAVAEGGSRTQEWWGRIRAARSLPAAVRVAIRATRPNLSRLTRELGRTPTALDAFFSVVRRGRRALGEIGRGRGGRR